MLLSYFSMLIAANIVNKVTYGGSLFNLMPTASSSASSRALCSALFVASRTIRIMSLVYRKSARSIKSNTEEKIYLGSADNLSSTTFAFCGTFDDTRQIENLNFSTPVLEHTRNSGKCCESICSNFGLRLGDLSHKC